MKLEMKLVSDAIPGSGKTRGGIVDTDICFDQYQLPYIPVKRIKGLLKENAQDLYDVGLITEDINSIFKEIRFSNGYLKNHQLYIDFYKYIEYKNDDILSKYFNKEKIIDFFTYLRTQTAIDPKHGGAKKHSLRYNRALKSELIFYFNVKIHNDSPKIIENLKKICSITTKFGINRNRGYGEIILDYINDVGQEEKKVSEGIEKQFDLDNDDNENKELEIEVLFKLPMILKNTEQILTANKLGNHNTTEYYIPGSTLYGTLAIKYIKDKLQDNPNFDPMNDDNFRKLFLNEKIKITNFYPFYDNKTYFPPPVSLSKHKFFNKYYDLSNNETSEKIIEPERVEISNFIAIQNQEDLLLYYHNISKNIEFHHSRPLNNRAIGHATEMEGAFFQYEVLDPGQEFKGFIIGSKTLLDYLCNVVFKSHLLNVNIGKSRSAQYGNSMIQVLETIPFSEENIFWNDNSHVLLTLKSDLILRNEYGFTTPDVDLLIKEFAEILGVKNLKDIVILRRFLKFKDVGGFKSIWHLPKIQRHCLAAGSEVLLKISNHEMKDLNMEKLKGHLFGLRTSEGFGQIEINCHDNQYISKEQSELPKKPSKLPNDIMEIKDFILFCISETVKNELKQNIQKEIIKNISFKEINPSFINRLKKFIEYFDGTLEDLKRNLKLIFDKDTKVSKAFKEKMGSFSKHIQFNYDQSDKEFKMFKDLLFSLNTIKDSMGFIQDFSDEIKTEIDDIFAESEIIDFYKIYCNYLLTLISKRLKYQRKGGSE